ncbi:MAG TPA: SRPBCC domain-containing protein [Terrimesophilobacter sp.]|nr:SRPBCC domain-containing protein [Terrimesophilobacter sp.]
MPVIDFITDAEKLTMTVVCEFSATPERVWQLWEDPRELERWWGPPEWPATFHHYDFVEGGNAKYFMTGPDGTKMHGWWEFTNIDAPRTLALMDRFAEDDGEPTDKHGTTNQVTTIEPVTSGTRMTLFSQFESTEQLEEMVAMGMEDGLRDALGQIDGILAG